MATRLQEYLEKKETLSPKVKDGSMGFEELMLYQELLYRIEVLEVCQSFCRTAPVTMDMQTMIDHYRLVDGYVLSLAKERRLGPRPDEKQKAMRETASDAMEKVVTDCKRRFCSFSPTGPEQYRKSISGLINTILPVWLQYRNTYINI